MVAIGEELMFTNITTEKWKINQIQLVYVTGVTARLTLILLSQCGQIVNDFKANLQLIKNQIKIFDHNKSETLSIFYCNLQNCSKIRKQLYLFEISIFMLNMKLYQHRQKLYLCNVLTAAAEQQKRTSLSCQAAVPQKCRQTVHFHI